MAGQLIQRGDRKWLVRVFMGRGPDGKRRYFNKTIHGTKKDAQRFLNEKLHEQDLGVLVVPSNQLLRDYLAEWVDKGKPGVRPRTRESYRWQIIRYINPRLGDYRLDQLTPLHIQELVNDMTARGLSPRTVRYTHSVLKAAINQAIRWRMLAHNPATVVELPKRERKEMRALSPEEANAFLDSARGDRWEMLWELLLVSGLRPGEALALKWTDVEWNECRLRVQRTLVRDESDGWQFEAPKTDRSRRSVVVPKTTIESLRKHRVRQAEARLQRSESYAELDLIFANSAGDPLDYRVTVRRHFKPIVKAAGLAPLRPYDLRHTCATLLLASGEHPKVVAERLGHASTVMTLDVYSHVLPTMQEAAADKLDAILFGTAR